MVTVTVSIDPLYTPTAAEEKAAKISAIDAEYQPQFADLAQAYSTALMAGDSTTATSVQSDYTTLKSAYTTAMGAIG